MTEKETAELRRHFRAQKCAVNAVYGCFVNDKKEIVCKFCQGLGQMGTTDADSVLAVIRKTLSGVPGKNLIDLEFSNEQVASSPEHAMLSDMRKQGEDCEAAMTAFFEKAAANISLEGNYAILVAQDTYDVPKYHSDDTADENAAEVYRYFLCAVCPVKQTKPALGFTPCEAPFRSISSDLVLGAPEMGFLFPAFDDRTANIYNILYYTKSTVNNHPEFTENVLNVRVPLPAFEQKEVFTDILEESLAEDCDLGVAMALRDTMCEQLAEYKNDETEEMPVITKKSVGRVLQSCGVPEEKVKAFSEKFEQSFGEKTELPPQNFVDTKMIEVTTPEVQIKILSDRSDIIKTKVIDGSNYILIRANNGICVNGVNITVKDK